MSVQYAGFWKRFGAVLIDGIILYIVERIIIFVLIFFSSAILRRTQGVEVFSSVLIIVISWLYYAFQESSPKQATLGKQALGIIVTDLNGNQISFGRATGRYFSKILSGLILLIGYIMAAFTEKKQALHDIIAGTLVVNK